MRRRRLACVRAIAWSIESDIGVFEETCGEEGSTPVHYFTIHPPSSATIGRRAALAQRITAPATDAGQSLAGCRLRVRQSGSEPCKWRASYKMLTREP